ncbi:MAG TPA: ROK family transcriptional regulator [Vicinamibacterales bacterium]|nr:ROK family transcriptional regulator [Vicinamibacterales bacterium]
MPPLVALGPDAGALNTRRLNRQRLLEAIRRLGPISRADLAKRTHLSPPTVSALIEELVGEAGLLREVGVGTSSGGRPPILLEFNADYGCLVGVDIGSRDVRFALADLQGRVLARDQQRTRTESADAAVDQVLHGIDALFRKSGRDARTLFSIGISAPGMTDVTTGRVIGATNLPGWTNVPLRDLVQARFKVPVQVDNDANMAALGERWQGVAQGSDNFVFVALGAGVGAGIVIGGRVHRGHHWYAGEISRMTLDYREWQVDFGERGYLETRIGADAAIDELPVLLGAAIANIVAVLDPALVVLGGGQQLVEPIQRVVARIVPNAPAIETSTLGDDAPLLGAVSSAMEAAEARLFAIAGSPGVSAASASLASSSLAR